MAAPKTIQTLIKNKILTQEDWDKATEEARKKGATAEDILIQKKLLTPEILAQTRAELYNLPFVDLSKQEPPPEVVSLIPEEVATTHKIVPFEKNDNEVKIAMVDPGNYRAVEAVDFWASQSGYKRSFYVTTEKAWREIMKSSKGFTQEVEEALSTIEEEKGAKPKKKAKEKGLFEIVKKAPVAKIVNVMIKEAVDAGASDVHIEPTQKGTRIRFRIDGILRNYLDLPPNLHESVVSRIKVLARLKIDETRIPQDGRIRIDLDNKSVDLRISTLPTLGHEKVVMRVLPTETQVKNLEELGFSGPTLEVLKGVEERPLGVLLISGPTGSGKSTTLYSILQSLNDEARNLITLEDPVEYFLAGVNQVQVNPDVGLTFASGLRSILRQDPNVIMVGEVRDTETADLAVQAALTGHFMLSTIHAKDVLGVIPRLIDMKVEPFLISAAMNTIMSQRLVRMVCENCKEKVTKIPKALEEEITAEIKSMPKGLMKKKAASLTFYRGKGCSECGDSGYKGRTVIAEAVTITEPIRAIIRGDLSQDAMAEEMARQGIPTLKQDGILKALEGITSLEEVLRVTRE